MSFKPYTEKMNKKKIGICSILGPIRIRIHHPGSGSMDPDPDPNPHQNDTDPKHWLKLYQTEPLNIDGKSWGSLEPHSGHRASHSGQRATNRDQRVSQSHRRYLATVRCFVADVRLPGFVHLSCLKK